MVLRGAVVHYDGVEVGGRRQRDTGGFVADVDRPGLLGVGSMLLAGLDRDSVCTQRHWLAAVVHAVPDQVVFSGGPRGARDGSELIEVSVKAVPDSGKTRLVFRFRAPDPKDANQLV